MASVRWNIACSAGSSVSGRGVSVERSWVLSRYVSTFPAIESRTSLIRLLKKPVMRAEKISSRFQAG
jgi:hypothetical protein